MKEKTSRSQEINVNSFNEELSSSDRTGRLVETEEIQTRSSEDSKSLNVEQTHDRTGRPVTDTAAVQEDSQVCHEGDTLNVDDEVLRKRMEKSIVVHDENHEPMMVNEADMDFRIPGLPHSVVKYAQSTCVRQLIQKIENHPDRHALQKDPQQNQSFNPFTNYVNYSRRNPKRSAKCVYHIGTLVSFIARAGTSCIKKEERICNSSIIRWTFFQFRSTWPGRWGHQGRRTTGGGGLARVPNLRVCEHPSQWGWHTRGEKDELTSCRGTV